MLELLLVAPVAVFFWWAVIRMVRQMQTRDLMDDVRADPAHVAAVEAELPQMRVRR